MEIKIIERGRYKGNFDIPGSVSTMMVGEVWYIAPDRANLRSSRRACSVTGSVLGKTFSVNCPGYSEPYIKITRTK